MAGGQQASGQWQQQPGGAVPVPGWYPPPQKNRGHGCLITLAVLGGIFALLMVIGVSLWSPAAAVRRMALRKAVRCRAQP